jgi:hypothetical protein
MFCFIRTVDAQEFFLIGMKTDTKYLECREPTLPAKPILYLEQRECAAVAGMFSQTFEAYIKN